MIKRILTAIVVLPVSFLVIGILTIMLLDFIGGLLDFMHLSVSDLLGSQALQASWQKVEKQFNESPDALEQAISDSIQLFSTKNGQGVLLFSAMFAGIAALIFFLSCLSEKIYVSLLMARRIVTVPLIFGYSFFILGALVYALADFICVGITQLASAPQDKIKSVVQFHEQADGWVTMGALIVTALLAWYLSYRLVRWDGLPWCRVPKPVRTSPHMSSRAL